jgi:P-type E1-E2 ATPase
VELVRPEARKQKTAFVCDGINDASAMQAATVGIAFGHESDIISEAAAAVVMERSLAKVDEVIPIGRRIPDRTAECRRRYGP